MLTRRSIFALFALLAILAALPAAAQIELPRVSPKQTVSQTIGVTEVTLEYSRPGVKGRQIWGGLVPYGEVWRTGANENTTVTFSHDVEIEGQPLAAGTYGVQTLPGPEEWTVTFSAVDEDWGHEGFESEPAADALRIQVKPAKAPHREWMGFDFEELTADSAQVVLRWEELAVPFTVKTDTPALVVAQVEDYMSWQTPLSAANYCIDNGVCLEEAGRWLALSRSLDENFWNLRAQARLEAAREDFAAASAAAEKALAAREGMSQPPPERFVTELEGWLAEWRQKAG